MRTTVTLDGRLLAPATELTGVAERGALLRRALEALTERESVCLLARLGGTEPDLDLPTAAAFRGDPRRYLGLDR